MSWRNADPSSIYTFASLSICWEDELGQGSQVRSVPRKEGSMISFIAF